MHIIDADGHVQEKNLPWRDLIAEPFKSRAPRLVKDNRGVDFIMVEGRLVPKPVGRGCGFVGAGDGTPAGTERFDHPFYTHAMAHPFEQMIAVLCVVVGGILERFPRLRVAFMEAGAGWVPYWMERLDEHYEYLQPTVPWLRKPPSEYMRGGQLYYAFEPDESTIPFVAYFVGEDLLIFASDYNHSDSKFPRTVKSLTSREDIPPDLMAKIMGENAARLYNL